MKTFKPKDFLEGKITSANCKHELLSSSAFADDSCGKDYECIICSAKLRYGVYSKHKIVPSSKFVFTSCSCLSTQEYNLIKVLLEYISKRYVHEKAIDIANIFKTIYPFIVEIARPLQEITDTDRKITLDKYHQLLEEPDSIAIELNQSSQAYEQIANQEELDAQNSIYALKKMQQKS